MNPIPLAVAGLALCIGAMVLLAARHHMRVNAFEVQCTAKLGIVVEGRDRFYCIDGKVVIQ